MLRIYGHNPTIEITNTTEEDTQDMIIEIEENHRGKTAFNKSGSAWPPSRYNTGKELSKTVLKFI